jgi:predicted permease
MGGDGEMMSAIIALSTLAALFTMPLAIWSLTP